MPGTALHNPTEDEASQQQQEDHQHSPTMTKYTTLSIQYRLIHVEAIVSALLSSIVDMPIGRYHRRDTSEAHGSISWRTFHRCQFHVCLNYEVPRILASTLKSLTVNTIESSFFTMNCLFWTSRDADVNVMKYNVECVDVVVVAVVLLLLGDVVKDWVGPVEKTRLGVCDFFPGMRLERLRHVSTTIIRIETDRRY